MGDPVDRPYVRRISLWATDGRCLRDPSVAPTSIRQKELGVLGG